jgi:hypothetical protein
MKENTVLQKFKIYSYFSQNYKTSEDNTRENVAIFTLERISFKHNKRKEEPK